MNLDELHYISISNHHFKRYEKLIKYFRDRYEFQKNLGLEKHHILPRSLFPQYEDFKTFPENKIVLPYRVHFIAHYLLQKITGDAGQAYACRSFGYKIGQSRLFEAAKTFSIKNHISKTEEGRKQQSAARKKFLSDPINMKNHVETVIAMNKREDVRLKRSKALSGEKNPFFGKKHTPENLTKISNSLKGRKAPNKGQTKETHEQSRQSSIRMKENNPSRNPDTLLKIQKTKEERKHLYKSTKGVKHFYHPITLHRSQYIPGLEPDGYIMGFLKKS